VGPDDIVKWHSVDNIVFQIPEVYYIPSGQVWIIHHRHTHTHSQTLFRQQCSRWCSNVQWYVVSKLGRQIKRKDHSNITLIQRLYNVILYHEQSWLSSLKLPVSWLITFMKIVYHKVAFQACIGNLLQHFVDEWECGHLSYKQCAGFVVNSNCMILNKKQNKSVFLYFDYSQAEYLNVVYLHVTRL